MRRPSASPVFDRASVTKNGWLLALALALAIGGCTNSKRTEAESPDRPAPPPPPGPSAASDPKPEPSAAVDPKPEPSAAVDPKPEPPPGERSPKCFVECNRTLKASKTSMCTFCRNHQIGAPADQFEAWDRRCSKTCDEEWHACFDPCVEKEAASKPR